MKIYNSLTRKIEEFVPLRQAQGKLADKVGVYACGPTVYDYLTIGNWRTYVLGDLVIRTLKYLGYDPDYIMNITDVGHLTGDNLGDADLGEDRQEKAAKREGKLAWDVADFYTQDFYAGYDKLNLTKPREFTKATDHIKEQIELVKAIEAKGLAYRIDDGIYFDTKAWEDAGNKYGELSTLDQIREGARVKPVAGKRDARDFGLWKFGSKNEKRQMEWDSPWGKGFPGWHIECSAMSMKYLGEQFDIHVGGEDLRSIHHPNEIAQSEAGTGKKPFVKYWLHGAFLLVDGRRMGKSLGNAYTLADIEKKGFDPLALRYFYLTGHYRKQLNFTWEALESAQIGFNKLREQVKALEKDGGKEDESAETYRQQFKTALADDLNMPQAMAVVWEMMKSDLSNKKKQVMVAELDQVLGLELGEVEEVVVSRRVAELVKQREDLRKEGKFDEADKVREKIKAEEYVVEDTGSGTTLKKKRG